MEWGMEFISLSRTSVQLAFLRLPNHQLGKPSTKVRRVSCDQALPICGEATDQNVGNWPLRGPIFSTGHNIGAPCLMRGIDIGGGPCLAMCDSRPLKESFLLGYVPVKGRREFDHCDRGHRNPVRQELFQQRGGILAELRVVLKYIENDTSVHDPHHAPFSPSRSSRIQSLVRRAGPARNLR